jgi:pimeloyl-ACP methyl ester carboxylesterase
MHHTLPVAEHATMDRLQHALSQLARQFPERSVAVDDGVVSYREMVTGSAQDATTGPVIVLLHGIGSGAASWLPCARNLASHARVIAWNAPGYGNSSPLAAARPGAAAYAARLRQLLKALDIAGHAHCTLVGHSLGALMAAAYAAAHPATLDQLVLLSPARGYGHAGRLEQGAQVARERLSTLGELGVHGMATQRSGRLLSDAADTTARDWVRWNMAQLHPAGYAQAVQLLCGDAIENYAPAAAGGVPGAVYCGDADRITPPPDCRGVAQHYGLPFHLIAQAGHACYVEQAQAAAAAILN